MEDAAGAVGGVSRPLHLYTMSPSPMASVTKAPWTRLMVVTVIGGRGQQGAWGTKAGCVGYKMG